VVISIHRLLNKWFLQLVPVDNNVFIKFFNDMVIRFGGSVDINVWGDGNLTGLQDL
jgi:hypothetical protein